MDEVLELQRKLAEAQEGSSSSRLSERNCIELVMKLQSLNLVDLIFTRSGKEYLTHRQLSNEIEDEILTRGGRVNVIDLPDALNVDLTHIEAKLPAIIERTDGEAIFVRGEVLTEYYLSSLAEEINDNLSASETGVDSVGAVATKYNLPVNVVSNMLTSREGKEFTASFEAESGTLRSIASLERARSAARGALFGITFPTALSTVADRLQIPLSILLATLEHMQHQGEIDGAVEGRGTRRVFVPTLFSTAASKAATAHFLGTGFITFSHLEQLAINNPKKFFEDVDMNAFVLKSCIAGSTLVNALLETVLESNRSESWVDVVSALPPDFPREDAFSLTEVLTKEHGGGIGIEIKELALDQKARHSKAAAKRYQKKFGAKPGCVPPYSTPAVLGNRFIVSPALWKTIRDILAADASEKANERAGELEEFLESGGVLSVDNDRSGKNIHHARQETRRKGHDKSRRGKDTNLGPRNGVLDDGAGIEPAPVGFPIFVPDKKDVKDLLANNANMRTVLNADYMGSVGLGSEMADAIAEELFSEDKLHDLYHAQARDAMSSLERRQQEKQHTFEKNLLTALHKIELFERASATLQQKMLIDASKKFIFESIVYPTAVLILNNAAKNSGASGIDLERLRKLPNSEKAKSMREVQRQLPPNVGSPFKRLLASLSVKPSNGFSTFLAAYDKIYGKLNLPERRPLDKKKEVALMTVIQSELVEQLNNGDGLSGQKIIEIVSVLLHARNANGAVVLVPSEVVSKLCTSLEANVTPVEAGYALRDLRLSLLGSAAQMSDGASEFNSQLSADSKSKLAAIRVFVG